MSIVIAKPLTFGVVAPSGFVTDLDALERASAWFAQQGHRLVVDEATLLREQRFAGSDDARIASVHRMFRRDDIDVVMAARGGYGLARLLDRIDYRLLADSGKLFAGHSDCTALQLAMLAQAQTPSLHGPTACYDFGAETVSDFTAAHFRAVLSGAPTPIASAPGAHAPLDASGTLWGGNLCTLANLVGTPWLPDIDGGILFLEDVYEHPYRVERMLLQLHYAGILDRQAAVLLGTFNGYKLLDNDNGYTLDSAFDLIRSKTRTPLLSGLPFGHIRDKVSLPIGSHAAVTSSGADHACWSLTLTPPDADRGPWQRLQ